jgi:hypothetical protein
MLPLIVTQPSSVPVWVVDTHGKKEQRIGIDEEDKED